MCTMPQGKKSGIRAAARRTDGLAFVVDPDRHGDSVSGKRTKPPQFTRPRTPDHCLKVKLLGRRTLRIDRDARFRPTQNPSSIINPADRAVIPAYQGQRPQYIVAPNK